MGIHTSEQANSLRALANGIATVAGSARRDGIYLKFLWGVHESVGRFGEPGGLSLDIEVRIEADMKSPGPRPFIKIVWDSGESAADVGAKLIDRLQRAGRWDGDATLDWPLALRNLQRTLEVAIRSRRRDPGAWHLHGALFELVGNEWAIAEGGIECPSRNYIFRGDDFPDTRFIRPGEHQPWSQPDAPAWANEAEWAWLIDRGRGLFPRDSGPYRMQPTWVPWTGTAVS